MTSKINGHADNNAVVSSVNRLLLEIDHRVEKLTGRSMRVALIVADMPGEKTFAYCSTNMCKEELAQLLFSVLKNQVDGERPPDSPAP